MNHYELLSEINRLRDYAIERFGSDDGFNALRAVVELHRPVAGKEMPWHIDECKECYDDKYPCPTIKAIIKELK